MTLNLDIIGQEWIAGERSWDSTHAITYALGVGAGASDPLNELEFTTENSQGIDQQVLPTFGVVLGAGGDLARFGDFPLSAILHAEQELTLFGPLPVSGTCVTTSRVLGILDKGNGAMINVESDLRDKTTHQLLAQNHTTMFVRGEGGFGGERGHSPSWERPDRTADYTVQYQTRGDQALLYRLSGDRNPLHSDPKMAALVGFDRPILHGLCTFGFAGRALLHSVCDSDPANFGSIGARFASPVMPGETLTVHMWEDGDRVVFQALVGDRIVLDRGTFARRNP